MSALRNFRVILDVDPDSPNPHCVGVKKDGGPCGMRMSNMNDRPQASALLARMDSQDLKDSHRYLEELAYLTLCSRWHRKPGYSQVGTVARRWSQTIQQLEKKEAEVAMASRSRQKLARKQSTVEEVKVTVRKERTEVIPGIRQFPQRNSLFVTDKTSNLVNPFIGRKISVHESVSETPFTRRLKASRTRTSETSSHNTSLQQSTSNKTKLNIRNDSPVIPARILTLPSPPDTPLALRQGDRQDTEDEDERLPVLANGFETEATKPTDTSKPSNSHGQLGISNPVEGQHQFSLPSTDFTFHQPVTYPNYWPETPKTTPSTLQQRERSGLGQYCITPATFNFETPLTSSLTKSVSETSPTMCDNANDDLDSQLKRGGMERIDSEVQEMHAAQSSEQSELNSDMLDTTSAARTPIEDQIVPAMAKAVQGEELPQTPSQPLEEENFGYAVITSSTRSRTYMPATQRYGLVTPPEEPKYMDTPTIKPNTPAIDNGPVATPPPSISQPKSFMIPRKPVNPAFKPVPPAKSMDQQAAAQRGGGGREETVKSPHGLAKPVKIEIHECSSDSDHDSVHAGCFHSFGIRRLREKIAHKVEHLRMRRMFHSMKVTISR